MYASPRSTAISAKPRISRPRWPSFRGTRPRRSRASEPEEVLDHQINSGRIEPQQPAVQHDRRAVTGMIRDRAIIGIEHQIVRDARYLEVAYELGAGVRMCSRRRQYFDDDHGVRHEHHL